jgi:hypothetical protein
MGLERLLFVLGLGFLVADARAVASHLLYWKRRPGALLLWPASYPPFFSLQLILGATLGLLLAYNLLFRVAPPEELFGEGMMFVYYVYAVPLANRVERGFYRDGVWTDSGYLPYHRIGSISWREEEQPVLLLADRDGARARRLIVPGQLYGAVRRLLRDLMSNRSIHFSRPGLDLGIREEKDEA